MIYSQQIRAIAFDLDGTLLDSIPDIVNAINQMLITLSLPPLAPTLVQNAVGKGTKNLVWRCLAHALNHEPNPELLTQALTIYEHAYQEALYVETTLFPYVVDTLAILQKQGYQLACVTNKDIRFTRPILEHAGLAEYFNLILGGSCLPERKPHPLPLQHVCDSFQIKPSELLMIGDSDNDVLSAKAAGCSVICVPYGYRHGKSLDTLEADLLIQDFRELVKLLC